MRKPRSTSKKASQEPTLLPVAEEIPEEFTKSAKERYVERRAQFMVNHPEVNWQKPEKREALKGLLTEIMLMESLRRQLIRLSCDSKRSMTDHELELFGKLSDQMSKGVNRFRSLLRVLDIEDEEPPFGPGVPREAVEKAFMGAESPGEVAEWEKEEAAFEDGLNESKGGNVPETVHEETGHPLPHGTEGSGPVPGEPPPGRS